MNNDTPTERWLPVVGFEEHYRVSTWGRIQSNQYGNWRNILTPPDSKGYLTCGFSKDKKRFSVRVHQVVASAFLGERPQGYQVNHIDGDKKNNHVENLEYVTNLQNRQHACEHGLHSHGITHHMTKLTEDQVLDIAYALQNGDTTMTAIARRHGTTLSNVNHINMGSSWRHLLKGYHFPLRKKV